MVYNELSRGARFRVLILSPLFLLHLLLYFFSPYKKLIDSDIEAWMRYRDFIKKAGPTSLLRLLVIQPEFRTQFALRLGNRAKLLIFLKGGGYCDLGRCPNIGSGFVLMHGFGTVINGSAIIGRNCTVLHNVTIGGARGGAPIIGDNVYIGAGALVIGGIRVGDNVKIGAGAIVVEDVPDNCTVVSKKAYIIKH